MLKNSEMRKIQWLSKGQLSQGRGKILFFHVFPVPDLSNLPHRVAQHDEILLQKLMEFSDSAFSRNFSHLLLVRYSTLSPPLPSPFPMAHHHATIRLSPPNLLPASQQNCRPHFTGSFVTSSKHSCQFLSLLPRPPLTLALLVLCLFCSALNLDSSLQLLSAIPASSPKRFQTTRITWCCPLPRSCPLETCIPLSAGCIPFPTSHQDSHTGYVVSYVGCVTVVYPPCSTALGSSLAAASFHLPFQVPASLPPSAPRSLPPSPAIPLKTQTGSWRVISFFVYL